MIQYGWVSNNGGDKIQHFRYYILIETGGVSSVALNGNVNGNDLHQREKDGYLPRQRVSENGCGWKPLISCLVRIKARLSIIYAVMEFRSMRTQIRYSLRASMATMLLTLMDEPIAD